MYDDSQIINGCGPMTAGDGRGRKFTVNGRPIRPSPSGLKKDGTVDNTGTRCIYNFSAYNSLSQDVSQIATTNPAPVNNGA